MIRWRLAWMPSHALAGTNLVQRQVVARVDEVRPHRGHVVMTRLTDGDDRSICSYRLYGKGPGWPLGGTPTMPPVHRRARARDGRFIPKLSQAAGEDMTPVDSDPPLPAPRRRGALDRFVVKLLAANPSTEGCMLRANALRS